MSGHRIALLVCSAGAIWATVLALLKIHGIIQVSWFWTLCPFWVPVATCVVVYAVLFGMVFLIMNSIK